MNNLLTSVILVTLGSSLASQALEHIEQVPALEVSTVEARCPSNCQGDFPVSSGRKYAKREMEMSGLVRG